MGDKPPPPPQIYYSLPAGAECAALQAAFGHTPKELACQLSTDFYGGTEKFRALQVEGEPCRFYAYNDAGAWIWSISIYFDDLAYAVWEFRHLYDPYEHWIGGDNTQLNIDPWQFLDEHVTLQASAYALHTPAVLMYPYHFAPLAGNLSETTPATDGDAVTGIRNKADKSNCLIKYTEADLII